MIETYKIIHGMNNQFFFLPNKEHKSQSKSALIFFSCVSGQWIRRTVFVFVVPHVSDHTSTALSMDCDFTDDWCGYNSTGLGQEWRREKSDTPSGGTGPTGPTADHTGDNGQ